MAISDYYNKNATLTVKTQTSQNSRGEPTFSSATSTFVCALQPYTGRSNEGLNVVDRGKVTVSTHKLYCATTVSISEGNMVTIDGENFDVLLVSDDAGRGHHLYVYLRLVS